MTKGGELQNIYAVNGGQILKQSGVELLMGSQSADSRFLLHSGHSIGATNFVGQGFGDAAVESLVNMNWQSTERR